MRIKNGQPTYEAISNQFSRWEKVSYVRMGNHQLSNKSREQVQLEEPEELRANDNVVLDSREKVDGDMEFMAKKKCQRKQWPYRR